MAGPTEKTIKRLFAMSGNMCAFPDCCLPIVESDGETISGEICHIKAKNEGGPRYESAQSEEERHGFDNLVLMCGRHHKIVDDNPKIYSVDVLRVIKKIREKEMGRAKQATDTVYAKILINDYRRIEVVNNSGNVIVNSPGTNININNLKTTKRTIKINPASGTIGADRAKSAYIHHLIGRYNEYASNDRNRTAKFSYGALSKNIETQYGAPWKMLAIEKFEALSIYLKQRIDKTRIAKLNNSKGIKSVSSFDDYFQRLNR
jgi:hypothetical protein